MELTNIDEHGFDGIEEEEYQPFDPERISIDTKTITMDTCLRRLEQGTIILNPDFQRNEVWTMEKKCRLIESLMLKIPLPMFYVSQDEKGVFFVVDGLQRLSTIRSYVLGEKFIESKDNKHKGWGFKLKNLEFWGDQYNGCAFNDLPINIQNRILETAFTFTIINPGTPEDVKRNIFKRINTGGEPLTSQEIRHALYIGKSTEFLERLSKNNEFIKATDGSVKSNRMMDRELILRAISFYIRSPKTYYRNHDMDSFLADTMRAINIMPEMVEKRGQKVFNERFFKDEILISDLSLIEAYFTIAMIRAQQLFGRHAFRKSYPRRRRTPINKALFEVWVTILGKLTKEEFSKLRAKRKELISAQAMLMDDQDFLNLISRDSLKYNSLNSRHKKIRKLVNSLIYD